MDKTLEDYEKQIEEFRSFAINLGSTHTNLQGTLFQFENNVLTPELERFKKFKEEVREFLNKLEEDGKKENSVEFSSVGDVIGDWRLHLLSSKLEEIESNLTFKEGDPMESFISSISNKEDSKNSFIEKKKNWGTESNNKKDKLGPKSPVKNYTIPDDNSTKWFTEYESGEKIEYSRGDVTTSIREDETAKVIIERYIVTRKDTYNDQVDIKEIPHERITTLNKIDNSWKVVDSENGWAGDEIGCYHEKN